MSLEAVSSNRPRARGVSMPQEVRVGTILMSQWPRVLGVGVGLGRPSEALESGPYSGQWSVVKGLDGFALDRKIRAAGWNFFFIASEVKVMFFGSRSEGV